MISSGLRILGIIHCQIFLTKLLGKEYNRRVYEVFAGVNGKCSPGMKDKGEISIEDFNEGKICITVNA